mmetsp:Transcript_31528/g.94033  ORF Transcript_31528/g.94033 Transcript_31528/m.94033 type:complete len:323 (-) Transcript_31528:159-1127(-)
MTTTSGHLDGDIGEHATNAEEEFQRMVNALARLEQDIEKQHGSNKRAIDGLLVSARELQSRSRESNNYKLQKTAHVDGPSANRDNTGLQHNDGAHTASPCTPPSAAAPIATDPATLDDTPASHLPNAAAAAGTSAETVPAASTPALAEERAPVPPSTVASVPHVGGPVVSVPDSDALHNLTKILSQGCEATNVRALLPLVQQSVKQADGHIPVVQHLFNTFGIKPDGMGQNIRRLALALLFLLHTKTPNEIDEGVFFLKSQVDKYAFLHESGKRNGATINLKAAKDNGFVSKIGHGAYTTNEKTLEYIAKAFPQQNNMHRTA